MHPDRMRRIDYWIGVPLCFVLTLARRLLAVFGNGRPAAPPRKILFIELAEMGSTVIAAPAVSKLKATHPDCRIFFLLFAHIAESVKVLGLIPDDHVLTIDSRHGYTLVRDTVRFVWSARRLGIDTTINLETFARYSTILAYLSGARRRVGFHRFSQEGLYTGDLLTHRVAYSSHQHTWRAFTSLVMALDEPEQNVPLGKRRVEDSDCVVPRFRTDEASQARVRRLLVDAAPRFDPTKRLVLVNPNASKLVSIRKWPIESYAALVRELVADPDLWVAITGVASEQEDAQRIIDEVRSDRVVDLTGRTTLADLIHLFCAADLLITNDSGPAHFASLTDIPIVVFFGPETPALYQPLSANCTVMYSHLSCSPCVSAFNQKLSPCTDNQCLKAIGVGEVYARVREILGRSPSIARAAART
jgi:ADP-heptose:LPS heptosyltransferase